MSVRAAGMCLLVLATGCVGSVGVDADAGLQVDAGLTQTDAGSDDAGLADAGAPDAGLPDAGRVDAGVPDAGVLPYDAGMAALIAAMAPNSWAAVPNTHFYDVCPRSLNHYPCDMVIAAWGGGAYDTINERLIVFGGGHGDSFYNNVFTFNLNEGRWLRWTELPDPLAHLNDGDPIPAAYYDGRVETCGLYPKASVSMLTIPMTWQTSSGYVQHDKCDDPSIASQLDPQQPRSTHTYGTINFNAATGLFYNLGSSALYPSGQATSRRVMGFDFTTSLWSRKADNFNIQIGTATATNPDGGIYYVGNNVLSKYDVVADTWTTIPSGSSASGYYAGAAIDPTRNLLVATSTGQTLQQWDLGASGVPMTTITTTGLTASLGGGLGFQYHAGLDRYVSWVGGQTVYFLNPTTHVWTPITGIGADPGSAGYGARGRWQVSPRFGVLVLVTSSTSDVWLYKPPTVVP